MSQISLLFSTYKDLSNLSKCILIIILLSLLLGILSLSLSAYFSFQAYLQNVNFQSELFIIVAMGVLWAGSAGCVSMFLLYFMRKVLSKKHHRILLIGSLISIIPCAIYLVIGFSAVLFT